VWQHPRTAGFPAGSPLSTIRRHDLRHSAGRQTSPGASPEFGMAPLDGGVHQVIEDLLGPEGLTERASSFGRRDVLRALADQLPLSGGTSEETVAALDAAADRLLSDLRVIPP